MAKKQPMTEAEQIKAGWKRITLPDTEDDNDLFVRFQVNGVDIVLQRGESYLLPPSIYNTVKNSYHMRSSKAQKTQRGVQDESNRAYNKLNIEVGQ